MLVIFDNMTCIDIVIYFDTIEYQSFKAWNRANDYPCKIIGKNSEIFT